MSAVKSLAELRSRLTRQAGSVLSAKVRQIVSPEAFVGPRPLAGPTCAPVARPWRDAPFFIDWVSMSQEHPQGDLPLVDAGCVWAADADGEVEWRTVKPHRVEGSHETSVTVKCDGQRVTFTGNVSRFGRPENLFGFDLLECVQRINVILAHYGLPPFTAGERCERVTREHVKAGWTGARFSRLDLTANYEAGSAEAAHLVMQYLGTQHNGRQAGRVLGQGETVDWAGRGKSGKGSRRLYAKAYIKSLELLAQWRRKHGVDVMPQELAQVVEHCKAVGLVRFELTAKSLLLNDLGAAWLGDFERGDAMGQLIELFNGHAAVMTRAERQTDDLDELPKHIRATARDYLAGMDLRATLSQPTFSRHRRALLPYGLDIAVRNVSPFTPRVRVVELARAQVPSWYQLAA